MCYPFGHGFALQCSKEPTTLRLLKPLSFAGDLVEIFLQHSLNFLNIMVLSAAFIGALSVFG